MYKPHFAFHIIFLHFYSALHTKYFFSFFHLKNQIQFLNNKKMLKIRKEKKKKKCWNDIGREEEDWCCIPIAITNALVISLFHLLSHSRFYSHKQMNFSFSLLFSKINILLYIGSKIDFRTDSIRVQKSFFKLILYRFEVGRNSFFDCQKNGFKRWLSNSPSNVRKSFSEFNTTSSKYSVRMLFFPFSSALFLCRFEGKWRAQHTIGRERVRDEGGWGGEYEMGRGRGRDTECYNPEE